MARTMDFGPLRRNALMTARMVVPVAIPSSMTIAERPAMGARGRFFK